jgi:hypothetical protein
MEGYSAVETESRGIHPEVRRLCRDAAKAINRYPVKDPLVFADEEEDDVFDEDDELEIEDEEMDDTLDSEDDDNATVNTVDDTEATQSSAEE